ncbi:glycosyltransferase [Jeotgalibaca sp. MA1X17-3]|uniref:glycosyltransferase family 2 protein n=1 Tax=Jeotgalibaca sp. MA1X17-3 TaxID=2908211 RepID=UPI001F42C428|nr:glycosyltransferase family 2 protein [Jeotgalibaca sp. MA1X17-3]UJF15262.1 glycosyltransferase [Jeotgalibaca sp. MA1X17-3]
MISVIIPAYNLEKQISNTLKSLINQTNNNFEIIVIDDGSIDNTKEVALKTLQVSNVNNFLVITQNNGGVSKARNVGLLKSKGEYIFFLDGDDYVSKDFIDTLYHYIDQSSTRMDVLCWRYNRINNTGKNTLNYFNSHIKEPFIISGIKAIEKIALEKSLNVWTGSAIYRKEILEKNEIKYTEGCKSGEDQEFSIKALAKSDNVLFINKTLSYYTSRIDSISNSYDINKFDAVSAMYRISEYLKKHGKGYNRVSYIFGNDKLIESYLVNYSSCLQNMENKNILKLNSEIERKYPGLNKKVSSMMKNNNVRDRQLLIKIMLFRIHPKLFNFILNSNFRKKTKTFKNKSSY